MLACTLRRGHPYVGAFLRKSDAVKDSSQDKGASPSAAKDKAKEADITTLGGRRIRARAAATARSKDGKGDTADAASSLYEIGTFAQVHTILTGDTPDTAQLLLLGHRRIKRHATISNEPLRVHIEHLKDEAYTNDDILKVQYLCWLIPRLFSIHGSASCYFCYFCCNLGSPQYIPVPVVTFAATFDLLVHCNLRHTLDSSTGPAAQRTQRHV